MHASHDIQVAGQHAGAAVPDGTRFRFVAADTRVGELDRSLWPSLPDVQRAVDRLMRSGLLPSAMELA